MLFKVEMTVNIPLGFPAAEADEIKQRVFAFWLELLGVG